MANRGQEPEPEDYMGSHHSGPSDESITRVKATEDSFITEVSEPLDDTNWGVWRTDLALILSLCGVEEYAQGRVKRPHKHADPIGAANWSFNDTHAKTLISRNIAASQMVHVRQCKTAHDMWVNLEAVHKPKCREIVASSIRNLFCTHAEEGDDIIEHLNELERYWEQISLNLTGDEDLEISDRGFKTIIAASLPPSWDAFTEPYSGSGKGPIYNDSRKIVYSKVMIEVIKEQYLFREIRKRATAHKATPGVSQAAAQRANTQRPNARRPIPSARACTDGPPRKEFINMRIVQTLQSQH